MRILVVSQYFWPESFRVNDLVADLVVRGHVVTVLTGWPNYPEGKVVAEFRSDPDSYSTFAGAKVIRVPLLARGNGKTRLALNYLSFVLSGLLFAPWKLRGCGFDLIFVFQTSPITSAIPAILLRRIKRAPLMLWVLDLWPESLSAVGVLRSARMIRWVGYLVNYIYRSSDRVLVQSRAFIPCVTARGVGAERIRYLPNWAEPVFPAGRDRPRESLPVPELAPYSSTFNIMFAGNIGEAQDFPAILDAVDQLRNEHPKLRWLIVGDGRAADAVRTEVSRRGLGDCFILLGRYPVERMPEFFGRAAAMLVTLRRDPVFSLTIPGKLPNYMAAGVPVLGMLDGEGARVIEEARAGFTAPAGNGVMLAAAVRHMMGVSAAERAAMGERGRAYCEREFNRSALMTSLEEWMNELATGDQSA